MDHMSHPLIWEKRNLFKRVSSPSFHNFIHAIVMMQVSLLSLVLLFSIAFGPCLCSCTCHWHLAFGIKRSFGKDLALVHIFLLGFAVILCPFHLVCI